MHFRSSGLLNSSEGCHKAQPPQTHERVRIVEVFQKPVAARSAQGVDAEAAHFPTVNPRMPGGLCPIVGDSTA